jgi:hypothetical protein
LDPSDGPRGACRNADIRKGQPIDHWLPKWDTLAIILVMLVLERVFPL